MLAICCLLVGVIGIQARDFTVVNNCDYPVWFGFVNGATSAKLFPADHDYKLEPKGGKKSVPIPDGGWSGVIGGRTNCTSSGCQTADCGAADGTGDCVHGFMQPATQAEFTLIPTSVDFYDVEIINGVNLPISITPSAPANVSDPYDCGSPGAVTPSVGLGACSWKLNPPLVEYYWVTDGGNPCKSNNDCSDGICGLSFNPGHQQLLQLTCGTQLGYWSADQICGVQPDYGAPFYCSEQVPGSAHTWWHYYACISVDSCYQPYAASDCCGCVNWDTQGIAVPPAPYTRQCVNTNPNWMNQILPTLKWLKEACPSAYTYPYDDMSSTYTCAAMNNGINTASYTITFCPREDK